MTLAYQVLRALLDHVDWMAHQDWQGREVKQVSQDPLDHQETGVYKDLLAKLETQEHQELLGPQDPLVMQALQD